ncbi:MAG TPA: AMP-binding protein [Solirubrobacteraceae bacterium]|nr:AMP-binding protein [Solirubrobacteraceae bacterium]
MLVESWLVRAARTRPDHPALVTARGTLTYAELLAAARAADLRAGAGERVALSLRPGEGFVVALHACLLRGAVAVAVDARLGDVERAAREAACAHVVREPLGQLPRSTPAAAQQFPAPVAPSAPGATHDLAAPAIVVHTSGSTGAGTPVELTFANWLWSALGSSVALGHPRDERWLCALPLSHVGGLSVLLRAVVGATTVVLHERFDTHAVLAELMRADGPTAVSLVPTTLARLLDAGLGDPPALRLALLGGAPVPPALVERAQAAGVRTVATYGLTEACSQVVTGDAPLFCTRVRIDAATGEILVAGPTVAPGAAGPDGWLRTGDLGMLEGGRLVVTGRAADIIVTGGENVAPAEGEAVLEAHPAVAEAAAHGRSDPEWGEAVVATVVLRTQATEAELIAHCRGGLAPFQVPKAVAFVDALPRTASGKVRRTALSGGMGPCGARAGQDA